MSAAKRVPWFQRRGLLLLAGLAVVGLSAFIWFEFFQARAQSITDPRLTIATPFLNVRPDVQYVGDEACASCHGEIVESYRKHSMGRSLEPVAGSNFGERYAEDAKNPFTIANLRYTVERRGDKMLHREEHLHGGKPVMEKVHEVQYAVGGGGRARSYLMAGKDGYVYQSPITWYPQKDRWDLSPGYELLNPHFDRPVLGMCLFCHANRVEPIADTVNKFQEPLFRGESIGCERCHGPGGLHVEYRDRRNGIDVTIVNPKHLKPDLRDAVCEQCHLEGEERVVRRGRDLFDYRPGLPLQEFLSTYVQPNESEEDLRFVGHVEQLHTSRCFKVSAGKMVCTTCHDPHRLPTAQERVAFFRQRCLECHASKGCSVPVETRRATSAEDSCMECHMPAAPSEVQHAAVTDHRLRRKPTLKSKTAPGHQQRPPITRLVHFHERQGLFKNPDHDRDYAIALAEVAERQRMNSLSGSSPAQREVGQLLMSLAEPAARRAPQDLPLREAQALALWISARPEEAAAVFKEILHAVPERELTLLRAGLLATEMRQPAEALALYRRAIALNPGRWQTHYLVAAALSELGENQAALEAGQEALRLYPINTGTRRLMVSCALKVGDPDRAKEEFRRLLELDPPDRQKLLEWFDRALSVFQK